MSRVMALVLALPVLLCLAVPAAAQPARRPARIGFRVFGHYEMVSMAATNTFDAVLGTSSMQGAGGGGEVLGIWKGLFARGAFSQMNDRGSRAFVLNGDVVRLNIPITVTIRTIELSGGWRILPRRSPRLAFYGGGGGLFLTYDESSDFADPGEDVSESFNGYLAFAGAEFAIWKWLVAGVEGQYRVVPDAIGAAGVSQTFNETDLGGAAVRVLIGIRR